ncbi:MAG: 4Fe-4S dicluster domain-containing protein [Bacillota bacterium]|jgi:Na+-translocating ferredoxin:NAD+ oxidoreductase RnfC subunit
MASNVIEKIKNAGIVGAGGAGFPSHVKYNVEAEVVVVNGAECEPLIRVDQQLMIVAIDKLIRGLTIIVEETGAKEGIIAIKGKHKEAVELLQEAVADNEKLSVFILDDFYPAGDEQVTLYEATGREVPQGGLPIHVGAVVTNVETLINVAAAVDEGKPVTETYITVTGHVPHPVTVKVPVGISVREALALAGVTDARGYGVIDGGPMMGGLVQDLDEPVKKAAKAYIVLPESHYLIRMRRKSMRAISKTTQSACIQCRYCTDLCPRYLLGHEIEPHRIMRALKYGEAAEDVLRMAFACCECGMCEQYSCPAHLMPRTVNAQVKRQLMAQGIKPLDKPDPQRVHPHRKDRRVPSSRIVRRIDLARYDVAAPLIEEEYHFDTVKIPLKQHVGAPSKPIVQVGDSVKRGDMIGEIPADALGAPVHASIDGTVTEITDSVIVIKAGGARR